MADNRKEEYWSRFANNFNEEQTYVVGGAIQQAILERLSGESDLGELIELGCGAGFFTKVLAGNPMHSSRLSVQSRHRPSALLRPLVSPRRRPDRLQLTRAEIDYIIDSARWLSL